MTLFSADFSDVILWQYETATNLKNLISKKQEFYNQSIDKFFNDWYTDVFNIDTANYFGLIVWAIILGCSEYVELTSKIGQKAFGFGEFHKNFYESNFALTSYIYSLPTESLRKVLKAQMYNFNSNGSLYDINKVLNVIYPEHNPYATYDRETNVLTYHFPVPLSEEDMNIVMFSNMLPAPVGVKRSIDNGGEE
jgi:hypothetical protein